MALKRI
jgi:ubiquitin-conjugating enzyme E2 D/E